MTNYLFKITDLEKVKWLKRNKRMRFTLKCGGVLEADTFALGRGEFYLSGEYPRTCPPCDRECSVEVDFNESA